MDREVLISLVVPVYNVFPYLEECMQSLIGQSFRPIEIICVDDQSTDGSWELLQKFAKLDDRVRLIRLEKNSSACVARARGAGASKGKYLMFVDPDDYLNPQACAYLYDKMEKAGCDMLHFTTQVVGQDADGPRGAYLSQFINPRVKSAEGDLVRACFAEKQFSFQLWNKIYRGDTVRKAMKNCPEEYLPKAQDLLAFFFIAYEARTYRSLQTEPMYYYRMGVGVTGGRYLTRGQLEKNGMQLIIPRRIREFLRERNDEARLEDAVGQIEAHLMTDSLNKLVCYTYSRDKAFGWQMLREHAEQDKLLQTLAAEYFGLEEKVLDLCGFIAEEAPRPEKIRTVGTFYPRLKNGGVQRVMAALAGIWQKMGYRVVVITEERTEDEYDLPEGVTRRCLPAFDGLKKEEKKARTKERVNAVGRVVREEKIDLLVSHQWVNQFLLWDMMAVRMSGAMFCIHCHSVFSMPLIHRAMTGLYRMMPEIYRLADGVVTLSDTDQYYWSRYNSRTWVTVNPLPFENLRAEPLSLRNHTMLWVGRLSKEKRPLDAIGILRLVRQEIPDARLLMVGGGNTEIEEELREAVRAQGLEEAVTFTGFQKDVAPYYRDASVFLCTSEYEGFSVSIAEAQINGLPVAGYDLFYLSILEQGKGSVLAPIGRTEELAEMITGLFSDADRYREKSAEALENVQRLRIDTAAQWETIFREIASGRRPPEPGGLGKQALDTIRQQVTLRNSQDFLSGRDGQRLALELAFPMPRSGPVKGARRKAAILSRVLLIDGPEAAVKRLKAKNTAAAARAADENRGGPTAQSPARDTRKPQGPQLPTEGTAAAAANREEAAASAAEEARIREQLEGILGPDGRKRRASGWKALLERTPKEKLLGSLAQLFYLREEEIFDLAESLCADAQRPKEIRTIGTFYPRLKNGGVQRVMARLAGIWTEMGYRVVVITENREQDEYDLPEGVTRRCLPAFDGLEEAERRARCGERIRLLGEMIREERIDLLVTHQWLSDFLLWDLLTARISGARFCIHCHNAFSVPLIENLTHAYRIMPDIYRLADGVFALSETDEYYWSQYNPRTWRVVNPLDFDSLRKEPLTLRNHTILWVGRLSREKRPYDVIEIMERVSAEIPDAQLVVVGGGNPAVEEDLRQMAAENGMGKHIQFTGFRKDVAPYYREAALFLSTSEYEGFPISISEAQINGLPVVGYDLFYLSILKDGKGCRLSPIGRTDRAAERIIELLKNPEEYRQASAEALENVSRFRIDLKAQWAQIFRGLTEGEPEPNPDRRGKRALDTIRQQATLADGWVSMTEEERNSLILDTAVPLPRRGHCRNLRRRTALLLRVLLIDGIKAAGRRAAKR